MLSKSSQYIDDLVDKLRCPISGKLFLEPVVASDGKLYESDIVLDIYLNKNGVSPITDQEITSISTSVWQIKTLIRMLLENYDYLKDELYVRSEVNIPTIISYSKQLFDIYKNSPNILSRFDKLYINDFDIAVGEFGILMNLDKRILKLLLSKMPDLNEKLRGSASWYPLNKAISVNKHEIVMALIEAGADINKSLCESDGWTSTHQIMYYPGYTTEIRKYFIDHCDDLFKKNTNGSSVMQFILSYRRKDLGEYALNKLDTITDEDKKDILKFLNKYDNNDTDIPKLKDMVNLLKTKN